MILFSSADRRSDSLKGVSKDISKLSHRGQWDPVVSLVKLWKLICIKFKYYNTQLPLSLCAYDIAKSQKLC